jgi:hypothetical protein
VRGIKWELVRPAPFRMELRGKGNLICNENNSVQDRGRSYKKKFCIFRRHRTG